MSTTASPHSADPSASGPLHALRSNRYDQVASLIVTMLIILGLLVFCMFIAWLGTRVFVTKLAVAVPLQQVGGGITDGIVGESMELNSPTWQDIAAESDVVEPAFQDQVAAVIEAVSETEADVADPFETTMVEAGRGGTRQKGTGNRPGKGRGEGYPGIPPEDRWEIQFPAGGLPDVYAKQLDFFDIELAVIGEGNDVYVATDLAFVLPTVNTIPKVDRKTWLWWSWRSGQLRDADRALLQKAGVPVGRKPTFQLYPDVTEQRLLRLEHDYQNVDASRIKKTVFEVIAVSGGYDFKVIDQKLL